MEIRHLRPVPFHHQQENWLWTDDTNVETVGVVQDTREFEAFLDPIEQLWVNGYKTVTGYNNKIPPARATRLTCSLRFIRVYGLELSVTHQGRVQGNFQFDGVDYGFWVTDKICESKCRRAGHGTCSVDEAFLSISLLPPYYEGDGHCHKVIAAVIPV